MRLGEIQTDSAVGRDLRVNRGARALSQLLILTTVTATEML
jgi:hypothetical protein